MNFLKAGLILASAKYRKYFIIYYFIEELTNKFSEDNSALI